MSKKWTRSCQWSEGSRDFDFKRGKRYVEGSYILQMTLDPMPGKAVKELYFTSKGAVVYVIVPKWPGESLVVDDFVAAKGADVTLLGLEGNLKWQQREKHLNISMPVYDPTWAISDYAYVFRVSKVNSER